LAGAKYVKGGRVYRERMAASPTRERRSQAERRAASEATLLRAAAELIAERGIERTSLRSIGAQAGTSHATPAYHFGTKEALVSRIAERGQEQTRAATARALAEAEVDPDDLSKLDTLRVTIETFLEVFAAPETPEERAVVVMWGSTFPSESALTALIDSDRRTLEDLANLIRDGQADGSIRADLDADAAAVMVAGMSRGVAALTLRSADAVDPTLLRRMCGQAIADALGTAGGTSHTR
jgi:AcrR family transcriptional regulator